MPLTRARLKISDYNETRKNRVNRQERRIRMVSLSLTSMVDMFAILVIFLLTNTSTVTQWIELTHSIDLPKAKFAETPKQAASLQVARDGIYNEKTKLSGLGQGMGAVKAWLLKIPKKEGYINLVADNRVPFGVIKQIIAVCQEAGFGNINLAVQPKGSS